MLAAGLLASCGGPPREEAPRAVIEADWPTIPADAVFGQPFAFGRQRLFMIVKRKVDDVPNPDGSEAGRIAGLQPA